MSLRRSSGLPRICSGVMYAFLPLTVPVRVREFAPRAFAMPKSSSFTVPSAVHHDVRRRHVAVDDAEQLRRRRRAPRAPSAGPRTPGTMMPATTRKSSIFPAFDSFVIMRDSGTPCRYSIAMNHVPANWPNDMHLAHVLVDELAREVRLVAEHRHEVLVLREVREDPLEHEHVVAATAEPVGRARKISAMPPVASFASSW